MTRKDYRAIADGFKNALLTASTQAKKNVIAQTARYVANELKNDNSSFRYDYFYHWIGLDYDGFIP